MEPPHDHQRKPQSSSKTFGPGQQEKQCRICYDSDESDPSLGRLFKPCLCAGSICVSTLCQGYMNANYARARASTFTSNVCRNGGYLLTPTTCFGVALNVVFITASLGQRRTVWGQIQAGGFALVHRSTAGSCLPPVVVAFLSSFLFVLLVMFSSYVTSHFLASIEEQSMFGTTYFFVSPLDVAQDLIRAAIQILRDQDILPPGLDISRPLRAPIPAPLPDHPGLLGRFIRRFLLGLPIVGVASLIHMILALPFMGPLQWIARWRGNRSRRGNDRDLAAAVVVIFIVIGAARSATRLSRTSARWLILLSEPYTRSTAIPESVQNGF